MAESTNCEFATDRWLHSTNAERLDGSWMALMKKGLQNYWKPF